MLASYNTRKNQILMRAEDIYDPLLENNLITDMLYCEDDNINKKGFQFSLDDILSAEEKRLLLLRYSLDLTYRELEEILGRNRQSCHKKIMNILARIREYLPKED